jgi:molybdate transport system ATP-binding protein
VAGINGVALSNLHVAESPDTALHIEVRHRFSTSRFSLDVLVDLSPGWTVIFGHSGAGKSTLLRCVAGLIRPVLGKTTVNGVSWSDSRRNIFVPPHLRNVGWLPQRPTLFPHLTVLENIGFGLAGLPAAQRREQSEAAMQRFHCQHLAARRASHLSGGELQRVALARTLARNPVLLLLDEPFSGLDMPLRESILDGLRSWQERENVPVLLATHDVAEACRTASDVVRLDAGRVIAQGSPEIVLHPERQKLLAWLR